jgi:ABC-type Fe3+ transport system substrate-binding protein
MFKRLSVALGAALMLCTLSPVPSLANVPATVLDAAKKEGQVVWYTTLDGPTLPIVSAAWKKRYPEITLDMVRLSTNEIPPKVTTEQRGGRYGVDLVSGDAVQMAGLVTAGAIEPYKPSDTRELIPGTIEPHGYWITLYYSTSVLAWNTAKLKEHGLTPPKTFADLTKPEWKGHIGLNSNAVNLYADLLQAFPKNADQIIKGIMANQPLLTTSHSGTATQLAAGEFDVTPTAYGYFVLRSKLAGQPVDYTTVLPNMLLPDTMALAKNQPHPNAARVLIDWLISREGQQLISDVSKRTAVRLDIAGDPRIFDAKKPYEVLKPVDVSTYGRWVNQYHALLGQSVGM